MKQLKALGLLKDIRLNYQTKYILNRKIVIDEAIKELEELIAKDKSKNCEESYDKTKLAIKALENRSCSNSKHWELGWCFKLGSSLDIGGCGDYWELK